MKVVFFFRNIVRLPAVLSSALIVGLLPCLAGCSVILNVPDPAVLKIQYPVVHYIPPTKARPGSQDFTISLQKAKPASWVDIGSISKAAVGAIVVSEDWAFYHHAGYDPNQIRLAIKEKLQEGRALRGASTITQQVARNVFLTQDRNYLRKMRELALAVRMEEVLGKRRILEVYLNIAELGEGIYGIGPAARFYFKKPPSQLTAKEGAFLAMLLPSPKRYSQSFREKRLTEYAQDTVDTILEKMTTARYLTLTQENVELSRPLSFEKDQHIRAVVQKKPEELSAPTQPVPVPVKAAEPATEPSQPVASGEPVEAVPPAAPEELLDPVPPEDEAPENSQSPLPAVEL